MNKMHIVAIPSEGAVMAERKRLQYLRKYRRTLRTTIYLLLAVTTVSMFLATTFVPMFQVSSSSMEPMLKNNDVILLLKTENIQIGDVIGFYYQNKLLLKRVIGFSGDVIDIDTEGNVTVNGELLNEPYLTEKALGETDLVYPYQVPDSCYFVMGDNRITSIDSRSSVVGYIEEDQVVGKVVFRVWPLDRISWI